MWEGGTAGRDPLILNENTPRPQGRTIQNTTDRLGEKEIRKLVLS